MGKNIWVFHHYATPPTYNGLLRPYYFGKNLKSYGYNFKVFSASHLHYSNVNLIEGKESYIINDDTEVPFIFIKTPSSSKNGIKRVNNMLSYYKGLFKVTKELSTKFEKPDLILSSSPHPLALIAGIRIANKIGVPSIVEIRDFWPEVFFTAGVVKRKSLLGKIMMSGEKWIYKKADSIIFLKEGDFKYLIENKWDINSGGSIDLGKTYYLNNGIDIVEFDYNSEKYIYKDRDLCKDNFNIVYTGAIRSVNNVDRIIDVAKHLRNFKDIMFLIYGEGNKLRELKERVNSENLNNIKFKGYIEKKYIPSILKQSNLNILNYSQTNYNWTRGNSSNKLFEYMAAGKPIISTVKMGYDLIDRYNCGISLPDTNTETFAKAILTIRNSGTEEYGIMSRAARAAAFDFDYQILSQRLIEIINETIEKVK